MTKIITDSSFIYALYNKNDTYHDQASVFASNNTRGLIIPSVIIAEVGYLFMRDMGYRGVQGFIDNFKKLDLPLMGVSQVDLKRIHEITLVYSSAQFDLVDCCIMALAERLKITQVATFDRRDFSIFRPEHCDYLKLLP